MHASAASDHLKPLDGPDLDADDKERKISASRVFQAISDGRRQLVQQRLDLEWALQLDAACHELASRSALAIAYLQFARKAVLSGAGTSHVSSGGAVLIRLQRQPELFRRLIRLLASACHCISRTLRRLLLLRMRVKTVVGRKL